MKIRLVVSLALLLSLITVPGAGWGQSGDAVRSAPLEPAPAHLVKAAGAEGPPARVAARFGVEPLATLVPAEKGAADLVQALAAWNRAGRRPLRTGIVRPLSLSRAVRFGPSLSVEPAGSHAGGAFVRVGSDRTVWGAAVEVAHAHRLRLHLDDVELPAGTRLWVYGQNGESVAFGPELAHEGSLWTPSVYGPVIRLEVELPREALAAGTGAQGFVVDRVAQIVRLGPDLAPRLDPAPLPGAVDSSCLVDASCVSTSTFSVVDLAARAVAHIEYPSGEFLYVCSGGLLNLVDEAPDDLRPPFLTANHCLSTPADASSLEAFWDYTTQTCDGPPPSLDQLPRTNGSEILATDPISDFTLLGLSNIPEDRTLLGWTAREDVVNPLPPGTETHRLSHPVVDNQVVPQQYSRYETLQESQIRRCGTDELGRVTDDLSRFHHSIVAQGGTFGGSSGAPLILDNGQVVGQLLGACGPKETVNDGCSKENDEIDGNFYTTFDFIAPFLGAEPAWLTTPEQPGFEFQVEITPAGKEPLLASAEADCIAEALCASGALAGRPEVFVKVIGPRPSGFLMVQISRFTPSRVEVWVRQIATGEVNYYDLAAVSRNSSDVSGLQDTTAFSP